MQKIFLSNLKNIKSTHSERIINYLQDNNVHGFAHNDIYIFNLIDVCEQYFHKITLVEYYTLLFYNPLMGIAENNKNIIDFLKKEKYYGIYLPKNLMNRIKNNFIKLKINNDFNVDPKLYDLIHIFLATNKDTFFIYMSNLLNDFRKSEMLSEQEILFICLKWLSGISKNKFIFKTIKFQQILESQARINIEIFINNFGEIKNFQIH